MNAVDTNVLARLLLRDDPVQYERAVQVMGAGVFIPLTVVLEVAWLLASRYAQPWANVAAALRTVAAMPRVIVEAADHLDWLFDRLECGTDAADLIHLVAARSMAGFVTFDRALARLPDPPVPVTLLTQEPSAQ